MNRIKKWLEQDPQRMHFIKIGLVLLGIILLIALPTLYLVLSGIGIWYFVKKAPDIRKRNLMIGLFVVSFVAVALQTPTVTKKIPIIRFLFRISGAFFTKYQIPTPLKTI